MSTLRATLAALEAARDLKLYRHIDYFEPYEKQRKFFDLGATKRERLLTAGNQQGKTEAGAFETACHLTGQYPEWWRGRRFDGPVKCWACGETGAIVRDGPQTKLYGTAGIGDAYGTGLLPRDCIPDRPSLARGVTDAFDTGHVKHVSGGTSTVSFKSYEQGRTKFQSSTLHVIWADEEAPSDVYSEMLARITATQGLIYTTFTPLKGMSDVVIRFLRELSPDRAVVTMTIEDALHIPAERRQQIIDGYKEFERDARVYGVPMLGEGRIFKTPESQLRHTLSLDDVPLYWGKLWGIDFGIAHPFAAVLVAWDKDNDIIYVMHTIRRSGEKDERNLPLLHAAMMKPIGAAVPVAWPQDGTARESGGETLASQYKKHGLLMLPTHATWPDGGMSTEAGLAEMDERMVTGRLRVASHLADWFEEYREYHRKDGMIIKVRDDILSATRVAVMMRRYARPVNFGGKVAGQRSSGIADGVDFPLF